MNAQEGTIEVLLGLAVAMLMVCSTGVLLFRKPLERLHCVGPASVAPVLVAVAVLVRHSSAQACVKVVLIAVLLLLINPVLTHVTARAERIRQVKGPEVADEP